MSDHHFYIIRLLDVRSECVYEDYSVQRIIESI